MINALRYLFITELLLLLRQSQEWLYPLFFFAILILLFPLALTPDPVLLQKIMPGGIWLAALLACLLSIENSFSTEIEEGNLEQLVLSSLPLSLIIFIKVFARWMITELPIVILTPLICMLFHLSFFATWTLCLSLFLGTPILTLIGTLGTALTLGLRQQGVLLGLLILPLLIPVLIFSVNIVEQSEAGFSVSGPCFFLAGLLLLALLILPLAIAATVRIMVDD